jgi:hypothetical protein
MQTCLTSLPGAWTDIDTHCGTSHDTLMELSDFLQRDLDAPFDNDLDAPWKEPVTDEVYTNELIRMAINSSAQINLATSAVVYSNPSFDALTSTLGNGCHANGIDKLMSALAPISTMLSTTEVIIGDTRLTCVTQVKSQHLLCSIQMDRATSKGAAVPLNPCTKIPVPFFLKTKLPGGS